MAAALNKIAATSPSRQSPSELETSIANALYDLESNIPDMKTALRPLQFVSAREVRGFLFGFWGGEFVGVKLRWKSISNSSILLFTTFEPHLLEEEELYKFFLILSFFQAGYSGSGGFLWIEEGLPITAESTTRTIRIHVYLHQREFFITSNLCYMTKDQVANQSHYVLFKFK